MKFLISSICFLLLSIDLFCLEHNVQISKSNIYDPEEVHIAINPVNPLNIVAASNIYYAYVSTDGGYTWLQSEMYSTLGEGGDPCLVFDKTGNLYYTHLAIPNFGDGYDRIVIQKSTNGGLTWDDGLGIGINDKPKLQDKPWMTIDFTNSIYKGNMYMAWTEFDEYGVDTPTDSTRILFARSTDNGNSWTKPIRISDKGGDCIDASNSVMAAYPTVSPDGEIYVVWTSTAGLMLDKSTDGGLTFGTDKLLSPIIGGSRYDIPGIYRNYCIPTIACDTGKSKYHGNIYLTFNDLRNGSDNSDVFLIKSTDKGDTWSQAKKINSDTLHRQQFFPAMCVDNTDGYIYTVFYDRRERSGDYTDVYMAKSTDGGETFIDFKVSESSFFPAQNTFMGDYIGIAAMNGIVYPVWTRNDQGTLTIWTALVKDTVKSSYTETAEQNKNTMLFNYPNPFKNRTNISYYINKRQNVAISVYNSSGELIKKLLDEEQGTGWHTVLWDATTMPSGVYFYMLKAGENYLMKSAVLIK